MKKGKTKPVLIIGRREIVDFPDLKLEGITAKIDTGAFTTALHCHDINVKQVNGESVLCFKLLDPGHSEYSAQEQRFTSYTERNIKNSFGDYEKRYIIKTFIKLGKRKIKTTISLANRGNMRYPVLIGRKFLGKKFLVDVSKVNTGGLKQ